MVCVCVGGYSHECRCQQKPRVLDCQEMELQAVMSHPTWVLGVELQSSAGAVVSNQPLLFGLHFFKNAAFSPLSYTCRPQESALCRPLWSLWNLWSARALVSVPSPFRSATGSVLSLGAIKACNLGWEDDFISTVLSMISWGLGFSLPHPVKSWAWWRDTWNSWEKLNPRGSVRGQCRLASKLQANERSHLKTQSGGLLRNDAHRLISLNTWSPACQQFGNIV